MMKTSIHYFTPILCAVIGWGTNFLAIKMLFRPHREIRWMGVSFQGVLPRRQGQIADTIGEAVEKKLVRKEDLVEIFSRVGKEGISAVIDKIIDEKLKLYRLHNIYPIGRVHTKAIAWIKDVVKKEAVKALRPEGAMTSGLTGSIDIKGLVSERIKSFSTPELEKAAFILMKKELRFVELMGAIIGFAIGLIQLSFYVF